MKERFKPLDKKDLPKLIGLVVLAVIAFVFRPRWFSRPKSWT